MFVCFPFISWFLLLLYFHNNFFREAFVKASLIWMLLLVLGTEFLSVCNLLTPGAVSIYWVFIIGVVSFFLYKKKLDFYIIVHSWRETFLKHVKTFGITDCICFGFILLALGGTLFLAIYVPPTNWDSMTYHLARIEHWIINQSLTPFPTSIERQLFSSPGSEFIMLHLQLLLGEDYLANAVQWFSYLGSIISVSLVTQWLGGSRFQQILSSTLVATLPMAILQATSTQNDLLVAFLFIIFVWFYLRIQQNWKKTDIVLMSIAIGLMVLIKPTAFFYLCPFGVFMLFQILFKQRQQWWVIPCVIVVILVVNGGHFTRNMNVFGHPVSSKETMNLVLDTSQGRLKQYTANGIKNMSMQLMSTKGLNVRVTQFFRKLMEKLGINPDTQRKYQITNSSFDEDNAANPIHFILVLLLPLFYFLAHREKNIFHKHLWFLIWAGFAVMCVFLIWSPWRSRYHIGFFIGMMPLLAIYFESFCRNKKRFILYIVLIVLMLAALMPIIRNPTKKMIGSNKIWGKPHAALYFQKKQDLFVPYNDALDFIMRQDCKVVGLKMGGDDWEYPLWALARKKDYPMIFRHLSLGGQKISQQIVSPLEHTYPEPCAIIVTSPGFEDLVVDLNGITYVRVQRFHDNVEVMLKDKSGILRRENLEKQLLYQLNFSSQLLNNTSNIFMHYEVVDRQKAYFYKNELSRMKLVDIEYLKNFDPQLVLLFNDLKKLRHLQFQAYLQRDKPLYDKALQSMQDIINKIGQKLSQ